MKMEWFKGLKTLNKDLYEHVNYLSLIKELE